MLRTTNTRRRADRDRSDSHRGVAPNSVPILARPGASTNADRRFRPTRQSTPGCCARAPPPPPSPAGASRALARARTSSSARTSSCETARPSIIRCSADPDPTSGVSPKPAIPDDVNHVVRRHRRMERSGVGGDCRVRIAGFSHPTRVEGLLRPTRRSRMRRPRPVSLGLYSVTRAARRGSRRRVALYAGGVALLAVGMVLGGGLLGESAPARAARRLNPSQAAVRVALGHRAGDRGARRCRSPRHLPHAHLRLAQPGQRSSVQPISQNRSS
jgi:hypothetical protein